MKALIVGILLSLPSFGYAQVKHNFEMGPENTNCAVLDTLQIPEAQLAEKILSASFRVREELEISRYSSPRKLIYASCDGSNGFLLAYVNEKSIEVYRNLSMKRWAEIRDASDPRERFNNQKSTFERVQKKAP